MSENFFEKFFQSLKSVYSSDKKDLKSQPLPPGLTDEQLDSQIKNILANESGLDRIEKLFKFDETTGQRSSYFTENIDILTSVGVSGFILGAILKVNESTENFKRNNQLTVYTDKKTATRAYVDYLYLQTVKGGAKTAGKFMLFSGIIVGSSMLIQAYRNKTTPFDYTIGGAISGGIFRMHYGLTNLIAGSIAGGLFGTVFGLARYAQMRAMNMTYEERRYQELRDKLITSRILMNSIQNENDNNNKL